MAKITQKQLIEQLKALKEIKPRQEWAVLLKSQILASRAQAITKEFHKAHFTGFANIFSSAIWQRKLAYSFATLMVFVSFLSFGLYLLPVNNKANQTASLTGQNIIKQNVTALNTSIRNLQTSTTKRTTAIKEISNSVKQLTTNLKTGAADSLTIKEIANGLKVLASVPGTNLAENSEIADLYETVVQAQIADLKKSTLTEAQEKILEEAEALADKGKYTDALEQLLTISK